MKVFEAYLGMGPQLFALFLIFLRALILQMCLLGTLTVMTGKLRAEADSITVGRTSHDE